AWTTHTGLLSRRSRRRTMPPPAPRGCMAKERDAQLTQIRSRMWYNTLADRIAHTGGERMIVSNAGHPPYEGASSWYRVQSRPDPRTRPLVFLGAEDGCVSEVQARAASTSTQKWAC